MAEKRDERVEVFLFYSLFLFYFIFLGLSKNREILLKSFAVCLDDGI